MDEWYILVDRTVTPLSEHHGVAWLDKRRSTRLVLRRGDPRFPNADSVLFRNILSERSIGANHKLAVIQNYHSKGNTV